MHGEAEATEHLAEYCRQTSSIQVNQVFTPRCGDTVDSTGERYIYQVRHKERRHLVSLSVLVVLRAREFIFEKEA